MRFQLSLALMIFLITIQPTLAVDFTVGVSPAVIDLGEVEAGSTKIVKFFLVTPSTEPLLVYLEAEEGNLDFFSRDQYKQLVFNYSEEPTANWVEFLSNPVEIKPSNESLRIGAGEIKGWKEISFLLNVPEKAEPGYHLVKVKPLPRVPSEAIGQAGARVVAVTSVSILFKIPGEAKREGVILDVTQGKYFGDRLEINTYFQNTGSVTLSAKAFQSIFNGNELIENLTSPFQFVKPGEVAILKTFLPLNKISPGKFEVFTTVDFATNSTSKISTLTIEALPIVEKPEEIFPWWVVILILILLISIGIYKWYK
ncbi:MAG: hypothetical protein QXR09_02970 [Candidatus Aenigmatarchaeota archaeon]